MQNSKEEIIDLTSFDYYLPRNNRRVIACDEVIDLVNESFEDEKNKHSDRIGIKKTVCEVQDGTKKAENTNEEQTVIIGCCSICWDKLGKNPLASTKCGHVYCLACLQKSLQCNKHCPTCRCVLKGQSAYHPLYLELS